MQQTCNKQDLNVKFNKIESGTIFTVDFKSFIENNTITFSREGMAIVYGPNGTGKSSFVKVLADYSNTGLSFDYEEKTYTTGSDIFFVINDQNYRNIIQGSPKDFLIGANINKEYELKKFLETEYPRLCELAISEMKNKYYISTITNKMIDKFDDLEFVSLIRALVNKNDKGKSISISQFIKIIKSINEINENEYDDNKLQYLLKEMNDKKSIIDLVLSISIHEIKSSPKIEEIEENTVAIDILKHFIDKTQCIVCDTININPVDLIKNKKENKERVIASLDNEAKKLIERILSIASNNDPFQIKNNLLNALKTGDTKVVLNLQDEIKSYQKTACLLIEKYLSQLLNDCNLENAYYEYEDLINQKPDISDEDFLYIKEIISGSMRKELIVDHDDKKNIRIFLSGTPFLEQDRRELPLSSGEQNFLSLSFEFLKAKNSPKPIVVLDDPISSFDSIYKNKVVYAISKILEKKQRIIFTHNVDLVRLLDAQYSKSFRMYILNNTENEINGFIPLKNSELEMLINLHKLIETFREKICCDIKNEELYLISMIPFMRGYANICNKKVIYNELTKVMHGYMDDFIDIAKIYHNLFDDVDINGKLQVCPIRQNYIINVENILKESLEQQEIVDRINYPMLDKTLRHTFIYLSLRLLVERTLVNKFKIDKTNKCMKLGKIIDLSFSNGNVESNKMRVKLTSKKTLINEFNHFEGNLSIFQPAIDITDTALNKEKAEIILLVDEINDMNINNQNEVLISST